MGQWWNDTGGGKWGNGGMILKGENGQWWNDTERGKSKYREKNLTLCHFTLHKPYMD